MKHPLANEETASYVSRPPSEGTTTMTSSDASGAFAERYIIEREIGRGGSAVVYLARDNQTDRTVALKVLRRELVGSVGASRFLREVRLLGKLSHPGIISVLDSGEHDGRLYVVLPYMADGTLRTRLDRDKQLPIADAVAMARAVAEALEYAHGNRVIHRDVKPENILFEDASPRLADFGIARAIEHAMDQTTTTTGVVLGTPAYMSPEQAAGDKSLDPRSDVYSLACVLYEMIAGMPAFDGPTNQSVLAQRMTHGPRPLHIYRPAVPQALEHVIAKALTPLSADRFQSAREFSEALSAAISGGIAIEGTAPEWTDETIYQPRRVTRRARFALLGLGVSATAAVALWSAWPEPQLDPNRIVVFPIVERGTASTGGQAGDEIALLIGRALEHTEPLRWIDGWLWMDTSGRANPKLLSAAQARAITKARGARYFVDGSLLRRSDSATVTLRLNDVLGDSSIAESASGVSDRDVLPQLGLRAVVQLLPALVEPGRRIDLSPITERRAAAVASWLQGERQYRQSHFASALSFYERALAADSALALAALKGAQAANWLEKPDTAQQLISIALSREATLPSKYARMAHGLDQFFRGEADSAASQFREALKLDGRWSEAWTWLGETYFHLFVQGGSWDSVAAAAFDRARREDAGFSIPIIHLTELALRANQPPLASQLLRDYRRFDPDSNWVSLLELIVACAHGDVGRDAWKRVARQAPSTAAIAAKSLALIARRFDCAEIGFRAVLAGDSLDQRGLWMATFGLQSLLIAQGRVDDARRVVDTAVSRGLRPAMTLYLVNAAAGMGMERLASEAMKPLAGRYEKMPGYWLWYHTRWETYRHDVSQLTAIDAALRGRGELDAKDRFFADVASANLAYVRGDTAIAIQRFSTLRPRGTQGEVAWELWAPLTFERLALAQLYLAKREFAEAIRIGDSFDHPQPVLDLVLLPASLVVRLRAAEGLRDVKLTKRYQERLVALGRTDLLKPSQ